MKLTFYSLRLEHRHTNSIRASAAPFPVYPNKLRKVSKNDTLRA